jgi:hypothetical protein
MGEGLVDQANRSVRTKQAEFFCRVAAELFLQTSMDTTDRPILLACFPSLPLSRSQRFPPEKVARD